MLYIPLSSKYATICERYFIKTSPTKATHFNYTIPENKIQKECKKCEFCGWKASETLLGLHTRLPCLPAHTTIFNIHAGVTLAYIL